MIEISKEDFAEYVLLKRAREIIVETLRKKKSISVLYLLLILGGDEALHLYDVIDMEEFNEKRD